jgi:20S proteasome subunit alpha 6
MELASSSLAQMLLQVLIFGNFFPPGQSSNTVLHPSVLVSHSQSARTYLEREFESFAKCTKEELVIHGLKALRECLPQNKELNMQNTTVGVVGKGDKFVVSDDDDVSV